MTGAPKILSRSDASARSARRLGFGAVVGGVWVQPAATKRLAASARATALPRRSPRHNDHKETVVIFVIFVAFVMSPSAVIVTLFQRVDCLDNSVERRGVDLRGGGVALAARVGFGALERQGNRLWFLSVLSGDTDGHFR